MPPPVIFAACAAGVWFVSAPQWDRRAALLSPQWLAAAVVGAVGLSVAAASVSRFRRAGTTLNPHRPDESSRLVTDGIFRRSRNPMYLALLICLVSWCVYLGAILGWLFLPLFVVVIARLQIEPEERALRERFGEEYEDYVSRVRRWI